MRFLDRVGNSLDKVKDLDRRLTLGAVISISISSMLGSGIFVLPGVAIGDSGSALWLAYLIAAVCVLPAAMSKSELATAMPTSGGTYVYLERTFGPLAGTLSGIGLWLSLLLKSAFALIGISAYLSVITNLDLRLIAMLILFAITVLNLVGVGKVGWTVIVIVVVSIGSLAALCVFAGFHFEESYLHQPLPSGAEGVLRSAAIVFVSYAGVTKVAAIAEEVKNPERNLPLGILTSLAIVTTLYCMVAFTLVGNAPAADWVGDLKPIHTLGVALAGDTLGYAVAVVAVLTMASMANAGVLAASRFPFAMSRDQLIPTLFSRLWSRFLTPYASILASVFVVAAAILLLDVERIAKLASAFILIVYMVENIAVIVLRETRVQWYDPKFRSPFYPWLQIFGIVGCIGMLMTMGGLVLAAIIGVILPGGVLYLVYSRHRMERRGVVGIRSRRQELVGAPETEVDSFDRDAEVVVPLFGDERSPEMLVDLGAALADRGKLEVVHLTEIPEQTDVHSLDEVESAQFLSLRRRLQALSEDVEAEIKMDQIVSHDLYQTVYEISWRMHCKWLVKEWGGRTHGTFTFNRQMGWLEDHLACHVMTFRDAGIRYIRSLLVLVQRGDEIDLIAETAEHLALRNQAEICFARCRDLEDSSQLDESLKKVAGRSRVRTTVRVIDGMDEVSAVVAASANFDLLLLQADRKLSLWQRMFGSNEDRIIEGATCSVVMIRAK